jgi:hypothetical protein
LEVVVDLAPQCIALETVLAPAADVECGRSRSYRALNAEDILHVDAKAGRNDVDVVAPVPHAPLDEECRRPPAGIADRGLIARGDPAPKLFSRGPGIAGCAGELFLNQVRLPNRRSFCVTFSSIPVVMLLSVGLLEPISTRLLIARPLAASKEPGELGAASTRRIFAAAGSMRSEGTCCREMERSCADHRPALSTPRSRRCGIRRWARSTY